MSQPWIKDRESVALKASFENLANQYESDIERHQCLTVAKKLDQVALALECPGFYPKSEKLYRESLDIKSKNLGLSNSETLLNSADLARVLASEEKFAESKKLYEQSLAIYRRRAIPKDQIYANLLEAYAQMLAASHQKSLSDKIYDEARAYYKSKESASN